MFIRLTSLFGLLLLLHACTSPKVVRVPAPLVEMSSPYQVDLLWQLRFDSFKYSDSEGLYFAQDENNVYFANPNGVLTSALKESNGRWTDQVNWQLKINESIVSGPKLTKQGLIVGTAKGSLFLLKPEDGSILWQTQLSSEVLSRAVVNNSAAFVRTVDGKLYSVNLQTGSINWATERSMPNLSLRGIAPVTLYEDTLYVGWETGKVEAIDARTGEMIWQTQVLIPRGRTDLERLVDIQAELILQNRRLYVFGYQGKLVALNPSNGNLFWSKDISGYRDFILDENALYLVDEDDILMAFDLFNGTLLWKQENYRYRLLVDLTFFDNNQILLADGFGYFHWIDKLNGTQIARATHVEIDRQGQKIVRVWVEEHKLYVQDIHGYISVYQVRISDWYEFNHPNNPKSLLNP
ncbi:MAG TPA: outer membrane protein assembly factor BamB [Thiomicrospira sp.]|nr:outer membrane protein assembly factor BamB [Thiomicrospira sp.]